MNTLSPQLLHDLRSPLTQIVGYAEMLAEEAKDRGEGSAPDLQKIGVAGRRMLSLLEKHFTAVDETSAVIAPAGEAAEGATEPGAVLDSHPVAPGLLLVVDDDAGNRDVLSRRLTAQGHTVTTASDGPEALRLLHEAEFDLVLLDVMMPEMDGYAVLGQLKDDPRLRHIPVVMMSALSEVQSVVRCIEAGAEDYLAKPFNPTLLKARIGACLEKKRLRDRESVLFEQVRANYQRLQELERLRDDMRNMIVHDLRTPLTAVLVGVEMLEKDGALNAAQRELMAIAAAGGRTLLGMINDLLDVETMEAGSTRLRHDELSAAALVTGAVEQLRSLADERGIALVTEIAPALPSLFADGNLLSRTLVNLIANGIKFTPAGAVTVSVSLADEKTMRFAVHDTGEGIPSESFERIFEKFGRLDSHVAGTGLGLAFCKLAVEAHGGHIRVESDPGAGSTFSFTIPLARPAQVLVIDDDPSILRLVATILQRADYRVDTATGGRDALAKIDHTHYDVVVLDLMMPEVNGFDVLARLEAREPRPRFVVVMSAASDDMITRAGGPNVFAALRKPFEIEDVVTTVRACIAAA